MKQISILALSILLALPAAADEGKEGKPKTDYRPVVHGTLRGKYEYQPEEKAGRFQVRTARVSIEGKVAPVVAYKAEIDLSDEGKIKMLDAYTRLSPLNFANRSFIAKQVGNVRDVGATLGYKIGGPLPLTLQAGMFNGSGLTDQKDFWTNNINYSAKAQWQLPKGFSVTLSAQKIRPEHISVNMYDGGITYQAGRWMIEAEYLYKHYTKDAFQDVNAFDGFICYDLPLKKVFSKISFLGRFDYMGDHSDGTANENGHLTLTDAERKRITGGITLSIAKPFISDIRINYEKYFYNEGATPKVSEQDKFVIEFMTRF